MAKITPKKREYDVVVVGAGPAGTMAAKAAVQNGAEVLLIEKKRDIGIPLKCGGIVDRLHLYEKRLNVNISPHCILNDNATGIMLYAPSGKATPMLEMKASIVDRRLLDKHLACEAARAGAEIVIDARVTGLLKKGNFISGVIVKVGGETLEINAKAVVGADGPMSNIGRWSGLGVPVKHVPIFGYEFVRVKDLDTSTVYVFADSEVCPGAHATWIPIAEDAVYLELLYDPKFLKERASITDLYSRLTQHPAIKGKLAQAVPVAEIGGPGPFASPMAKTVTNGVLLAGDAAGQSLAAQVAGIGSAMECGHFAGEVAAKAAKEGDTSEQRLKEYEDKWRGSIGKTVLAHVEGNDLYMQIAATNERIEKATEELGKDFIGLIIFTRRHLEAAKKWLGELKK